MARTIDEHTYECSKIEILNGIPLFRRTIDFSKYSEDVRPPYGLPSGGGTHIIQSVNVGVVEDEKK